MKRIINYFRVSWAELGKISWPNREQTLRLTGAVVVFSVILAAFIGTIDFGLARLVQKVIVK